MARRKKDTGAVAVMDEQPVEAAEVVDTAGFEKNLRAMRRTFGVPEKAAGDSKRYVDAMTGKNGNGKAAANGKPKNGWAAAIGGNGKPKKERAAPALERMPRRDLPAEMAGQGTLITVPFDEIVPNPWNPRANVDDAAVAELAESIRAHGVLSPPTVRPRAGGNWELVCGERRWRAAQIAAKETGVDSIRVLLCELDDRQAHEIALAENVARRDLSPVEEAIAFEHALDGEDAPTQVELAARLGCSQGHISNRLRLLRLPADWQKRIISGKITEAHARALLPYAESPGAMRIAAKSFAGFTKDEGRPPSAEEFADEFDDDLRRDYRDETRGMAGTKYHNKAGREVPVFTPTDEQRAQLDIVLVEDGTRRGGNKHPKQLERATNVKLWDKLQQAHAKKWLADHPADKGGRKSKPAAKKSSTGGKEKPLTAAEQKRQAEEERARAKERARQHARRLWEFKVDWMRWLVAAELRQTIEDGTANSTANLATREAIWAYFAAWRPFSGHNDMRRDLVAAVKMVGKGTPSIEKLYDAFCELNQVQGSSAAAATLAGWFYDEKEGPGSVPDKAVETTIGLLEINLAEAWKANRAGPLTERFFNLFSKDELIAMAERAKVKRDRLDTATKGSVVQSLLAIETFPYPAELDKAKRVR